MSQIILQLHACMHTYVSKGIEIIAKFKEKCRKMHKYNKENLILCMNILASGLIRVQ